MPDRLEKLCIAKGMRMTEQRRVIARVLSESEDHPDVEELYRRASKLDPRVFHESHHFDVERQRLVFNPFSRLQMGLWNRHHVVVAVLAALADTGTADRSRVAEAMARYGIGADGPAPWIA